MSLPSIVPYGAAAKTSSLVWDGDLVIPDGYAIESASGEVGIVGDVSISGSLSAENTVHGNEEVTSALITATNTDITTLTVNGYSATVITSQATINITSKELTLFPITPSPVQVSGTLNGKLSGQGHVPVTAYADCITPVSITTIPLGSKTITGEFTINVSGTIPAHTFGVMLRLSRRDTSITSASITSNSYTSTTIV